MTPNTLNFSGGPGALPETVLAHTQQAIIALPDTGISVLGMSHRSEWFRSILDEAETNIRHLLGLSNDYGVAFLQGGSSLQFAMIPMNFAALDSAPPAYVTSGYWSGRATAEAAKVTSREIVWDGKENGYRTLPDLQALRYARDAAYLHYVSNETVEGLQFPECAASLDVPLIADMSSDFLSKPIDPNPYSMIYAHAQKNLGPSGVTIAIVKHSMLERVPNTLPAILDLRTHINHKSNYNTPPVFAIYVMTLITRWLRDDIGGLEAMRDINARKARAFYDVLDELSGLISVHATRTYRSKMNVAFKFADSRLDTAFLDVAKEAGVVGLEGHRSIGGLRASLYNAVTEDAVSLLSKTLRAFAKEFA